MQSAALSSSLHQFSVPRAFNWSCASIPSVLCSGVCLPSCPGHVPPVSLGRVARAPDVDCITGLSQCVLCPYCLVDASPSCVSARCPTWISPAPSACFVSVPFLFQNELIRNAVPGVARCIVRVHVAHSMRPPNGVGADLRLPTMLSLSLSRHSECATTLASR